MRNARGGSGYCLWKHVGLVPYNAIDQRGKLGHYAVGLVQPPLDRWFGRTVGGLCWTVLAGLGPDPGSGHLDLVYYF
jgi:hypothetical protein